MKSHFKIYSENLFYPLRSRTVELSRRFSGRLQRIYFSVRIVIAVLLVIENRIANETRFRIKIGWVGCVITLENTYKYLFCVNNEQTPLLYQ
jgi:hypothetical protein